MAEKSEIPNPVFLIVLRNRAGMMRSVSMLARSMKAVIPLSTTNLGIPVGVLAAGGAAADCVTPSSTASVVCTVEIGAETGEAIVIGVEAIREATVDLTGASFRASVRRPVIAAAAAIAGLIKCVRPPGPCRPSKFLLDVEAHRSPGESMSGFIPKHIEQPASLQSNPASIKILSSPSDSA